MTPPAPHTVHLRIVGTRNDVAFWLRLLNELSTVQVVSELATARGGKVRVYMAVTRTAPLKGHHP